MNHEEKNKMTDYLIAITIIFIIVSIFAAIRANAQSEISIEDAKSLGNIINAMF